MSHLLTRLLLAFAALLAAPVLYTISYLLIERSLRDTTALAASNVITGVYLIVAWVLVWRRQIRWTPHRRVLTVLAPIWSAVAAVFVGLGVATSQRGWGAEVGILTGGMVWMISWLLSTIMVWRETELERSQRLAQASSGILSCPHCGYNMTGLKTARCPECGTEYTLNELLAALQAQTEDLDTGEKVS